MQEIIERGYCGNNAKYTVSVDGILNIEGYGPMFDFKPNSCLWGGYRITKVNVNKDITYIGTYSFTNCNDIIEINAEKGIFIDSDSVSYKQSQIFSHKSIREELKRTIDIAYDKGLLTTIVRKQGNSKIFLKPPVNDCEEFPSWGMLWEIYKNKNISWMCSSKVRNRIDHWKDRYVEETNHEREFYDERIPLIINSLIPCYEETSEEKMQAIRDSWF